MVFNMFFMNLPVEGEPVDMREYFAGRPVQHLYGWAGGAIWCVGAVCAFVAASTSDQLHIGPAVSYAMGQGATLISALWGIFVWKEFKGGDFRVKFLLGVVSNLDRRSNGECIAFSPVLLASFGPDPLAPRNDANERVYSYRSASIGLRLAALRAG